MSAKPSLALIGCGKMGQALLKGWLSQNLDFDISVIQPVPVEASFDLSAVSYFSSFPEDRNFDVIVLAVKPQIIKAVCQGICDVTDDQTLIISIAAGKQISFFEGLFSVSQPLIRAMPNTPAAVGQGLSGLCANQNVSEVQKDIAACLFKASGAVIWLEDETQMNALTAISGSGPAYVFYFIEALSRAAQALGFEADMADLLARQTVIGAAMLAANESDTSAGVLRENVTSPGGTTEAALKVLMDGRLDDLLKEATRAASSRGEALSA